MRKCMGYRARLPTFLVKNLDELTVSPLRRLDPEVMRCMMNCSSNKYLKHLSGTRDYAIVWSYKDLWYIPIADNAKGFYRYAVQCHEAQSYVERLHETVWFLLQPMAYYGNLDLLRECMRLGCMETRAMMQVYGSALVELAIKYRHADVLRVLLQLGARVPRTPATDPNCPETKRSLVEFLTPLVVEYPDRFDIVL